jgi:hypothetical protein
MSTIRSSLRSGVIPSASSLPRSFAPTSSAVRNANVASGPTGVQNTGIIAGVLAGLFALIAIGVIILLFLRRRRDDQECDGDGYETETEAVEEILDASVADFGTSVDVGLFSEEVGLGGVFGMSDAFGHSPEESPLFF